MRWLPHLVALCFDAIDPLRLARFWAGVLGWEIANATEDGIALLPSDDTGFKIRFPADREAEGRPEPDSFRSDEHVAGGPAADGGEALRLGARYIDIGQRGDEGHVVLADPEVNEFCVIEPGNSFLADCGFIGARALRRFAGGRVLLERSAGVAIGLRTRTRRPRSSRRAVAQRSPGVARR